MAIEKLNPREALGFLAWKVARLKANDLAARFAEAGIEITVEQWRVLVTLYKNDGLTQGKMCDVLSQEKTGVSRLVAGLEKRSYLIRKPGEDDRRVKYLFITDEGRAIIDETIPLALQNMGSRESVVDPEELAICKRVLWQIIEPTFEGTCCSQDEE